MSSKRAWASRLYVNEHDLEQMQGLLMEARSSIHDGCYWHVGELIWGFFMVACHLNLGEHIRLWHDEKRKLVGYAILGEDPSFDYQVRPEYESAGIEAEAMEWAQTRLAELRQRDSKRWSGSLGCSTRQDDAKRIVFLEKHRFRRGEYAEVNMLRSLDEPIPELTLPPGYQVRAVAGSAYIPDRAAIQREVWHPWTVGNVSDDNYASLMQLPGYNRDLDLITIGPDGVIAAYVNGWIDPINRIGVFGPVGAREAFRRKGLTRAALVEGLHRMKAHGMIWVYLSTGVSNTPALRLYESIGFRGVNRCFEYVKAE